MDKDILLKSNNYSEIIPFFDLNIEKNNNRKIENYKKINLKELIRLSLFIIISIFTYFILIIIDIKLINFLGDKYLLNVNNARLIVSISSLIGSFVFFIFANKSINKIIKYLIIHDLQETGINLLTLNSISEKGIIKIIIYIFKNKKIRWI